MKTINSFSGWDGTRMTNSLFLGHGKARAAAIDQQWQRVAFFFVCTAVQMQAWWRVAVVMKILPGVPPYPVFGLQS